MTLEEQQGNTSSAPVVIIGGGPTGLSLALGLSRLEIRSILLEKKKGTSQKSKAPGIHIRTREAFKTWGIEQKILDEGNLVQKVDIHSPKDNSVFFSVNFQELQEEAHKPGLLVLEQGMTEKILCRAVAEAGFCDLRFNTEAFALKQDDDQVEVRFKGEDGEEEIVTASYVAGCDGAGSFVRHALDLPFEGFTYSIQAILADIAIKDKRNELPWPRFYNGKGITMAIKLDKELWRIIRLETGSPYKDGKVPKNVIKKRVKEVLGEGDFYLEWANPFRIHRRSSPKLRVGRVLLAGDAAHVHSPAGGQGMNSGIQDAHNLAWKLALALKGSRQDILETYEFERQQVVTKKVSRYTNFLTRVFLQSPSLFRIPAFFLVKQLLKIRRARLKFLRRATMINLAYDNSSDIMPNSFRAGKRLPNYELLGPRGEKIRLYDLLTYSFIVLEFKDRDTWIPHSGFQKIRIGEGGYLDPKGFLLRFIDHNEGWILVRPDAHIAWTGNDENVLDDSLRGMSS